MKNHEEAANAREDRTDGQRGERVCREECSPCGRWGERRRDAMVVGVDGGKDAHPLYPTTAQRSASARLIQSDQVWTPSPINPGMWRWWMWAINPPALTCREQHGEPWENVSAPGKCQRGPGVRRGWWRERKMGTWRDERCGEGHWEEWAGWEQIVKEHGDRGDSVTEFTVTLQWFSCHHVALNSCCSECSEKFNPCVFRRWGHLNIFFRHSFLFPRVSKG